MDYQAFFNKSDYLILDILIGNECYSAFKSLTTSQIIQDTKLSHVKVRTTLKNFMMASVVSEGTKDGNNKTYFVTDGGREHYMNVFEYNEDDIADLVLDIKEMNAKREKLKENNDKNNKGEI